MWNAFLLGPAAKSGANPRTVAGKLVRLCERRKVTLRTRAGLDAWGAALARRILPWSWMGRATELIFRKVIFRD